LGVLEWQTPAAAANFVFESGALPQVFHSMTDGSYLVWAAADHFPVYVDGRLEVYGEDFFKQFFRFTVRGRDWDAFADSLGINTAILQTEFFEWFVAAVASSPQWVLVH